MAQPQPKSSPLNDLCSALPSLPARLQQVGRFVAANDYDATTRSMRDLAAEAEESFRTQLKGRIGNTPPVQVIFYPARKAD